MLQLSPRQSQGSRARRREIRPPPSVPMNDAALARQIKQVSDELYALASSTPSWQGWKIVCYAFLMTHIKHYDLRRQMFDEYTDNQAIERDLERVKGLKNKLRNGQIDSLPKFMEVLPKKYIFADLKQQTRHTRNFLKSFISAMIISIDGASHCLLPVNALSELLAELNVVKRTEYMASLMSTENLQQVFLRVAA